ncbi:MAG: C45 family autoproteolytic acyltransferase/hydrolase [Bacteroidales bacterium]|nr:C45 family autoproteolytic acyltransferase/hydrolase [Bacteroidales bacterium]
MKNLQKNMPVAMAMAMATAAASCAGGTSASTENKASFITDAGKLEMIHSMKDLDGNGRLYEIDYNQDYMLDSVMQPGITEQTELFRHIASLLFDNLPAEKPEVKYGAGCSAFAAQEAEGKGFLMGRNYDFRHFTPDNKSYLPTSAILVRTAPEGGKKSISMVDGLNLGFGQGFYNDGKTDLSMLMALPYAALDGINEDGFAIGVLALNEKQTNQQTGKQRIGTTVAIRMMLDKASTVREAIEMLKNYDMDMRGNGHSNYHFFMADATGDYAIVEYTFDKDRTEPRVMEVFSADDSLRCVTNFYVAPSMTGTTDGWGSSHGKDRYENLRKTLDEKKHVMKEDEAMQLLEKVSQPPTEELTSQTQWSALYNLTEKTLRLTILREYAKEYNFRIE